MWFQNLSRDMININTSRRVCDTSMSYSNPPSTVQIKRKRDEDPLQALLFEKHEAVKRHKNFSLAPKNYYFRLTRTEDITTNDVTVLESLLPKETLLKKQGTKRKANFGNDMDGKGERTKRKFVIPQRKEEDNLHHELSDMIESYLNIEKNGEDVDDKKGGYDTSRKKSYNKSKGGDSSDFDYVYDVYRLTATSMLKDVMQSKSGVGYVNFGDDFDFYQSEDDDEESRCVSDDEDSNAESYYQNDYPSNEDYESGDEKWSFEEESIGEGKFDDDDDPGQYEDLYERVLDAGSNIQLVEEPESEGEI